MTLFCFRGYVTAYACRQHDVIENSNVPVVYDFALTYFLQNRDGGRRGQQLTGEHTARVEVGLISLRLLSRCSSDDRARND